MEAENHEGLYLKGFNDAYKLAKYQPELMAKVQPSIQGGDEYEKGFLEGAKQYEKEKGQEKSIEDDRMKDLHNLRQKGKDRENNKVR